LTGSHVSYSVSFSLIDTLSYRDCATADLRMFSLKDLPRTRLAPLPPKHVLQTSIHSSRSSPEAFFVHHFRVHVADLICFSRAGRGNPFLTYILPLVNSSQLVHVAIEAVAAAHLHVLGTASLVDAERLQLKTFQLLAKYLSNGQEDGSLVEQALAGSLLLIYYEVFPYHSAVLPWRLF